MEEKYYSRIVKVLVFAIDLVFIQFTFSFVKLLGLASDLPSLVFASFSIIFSLLWIITGFLTDIYGMKELSLLRTIGRNFVIAILMHIALLGIVSLFFDWHRFDARFFAAVYFLISVLMVGWRVSVKLIRKYMEFSSFDQRKVVIVGTTRSGKALYEFFESHEYSNYHFQGFFDDNPDTSLVPPDRVLGPCSKVEKYCRENNISEIYFALPLSHEETMNNISRFAQDNFIYLRIVPDFSKAVAENHHVYLFDSVPVITQRNEPLGISLNAGAKRLFDVVFSLFVILFIFPFVLPPIVLAIRLDSEGPIIFKQLRRGKKNKLFECYKFRTMKVNCDAQSQATRNDARVTKVGRFLRETNLDELPQFVNVLLGNMSVVGPRPHITKQDEYAQIIRQYHFRYFITPGITGYAQVNGYRGETKEPELMAKRVEYDIKYMENWSFTLDMQIILQTVWMMIRGRNNAY